MKKSLKIIIIAVASIVLFLLLVSVVAGPIAKHVVESKSLSWIGREVSIDKVSVNLFAGSVTLRGVKVSDEVSQCEVPGEGSEFVSFGELYVQASIVRLIGKNVYLRHIHLSDFSVNVWSNDSCFNFSDLPHRFSSKDSIPEVERDTTAPAWRISLNDIRLRDGKLSYSDLRRDNHWGIEHVNLIVPGLYFGDRQTDAGLSLALPDGGGNLRLRGAYNMSSNTYSVIADLQDIDLSQAEPVLKEHLNIHSFAAWLSGHLTAAGSLDNIMGVRVHGNMSLRDLELTDERRKPIATMKKLTVGITEISPGPAIFRLDSVLLDSITVHFERAEDHTTLSSMLAKEEIAGDESADAITAEEPEVAEITESSAHSSSAKRPDVIVRSFLLRNTSVHYTDKTLFSDFRYDIRNITARAQDLTLAGDNHVVVSATLPDGGSMMANWRGGMDFHKDNVRVIAMLKNVQLADLSPWIEYMFAYKVTGGTLSLTSDNTIRHGVIDATEKLDIHELTLGKKNDKLDAELKNVPLKLGVELLKDINGKISLNVPITGDINSPKFSLGRLIARTIGNIFLKATAAPFVAIASATDKSAGDLTQIELDLLTPDFSLEQYKKLDLIAEMMRAHEDISLELYQQFNLQKAIEERAVFNLKRGYYESQNELVGNGHLSLIDIEKIRSIKQSNSGFKSYAAYIVGNGELTRNAVQYYHADSLAAEVIRHAERRDRFVVRYLTEQQGVSKERVSAATASQDELKAYKGKSRYEVRGETRED